MGLAVVDRLGLEPGLGEQLSNLLGLEFHYQSAPAP
jgi:hypothetical protein